MAGDVREDAPAKVNLCLHVTGRRADGYHLLDSIAVFAGIGDTLHAAPADAGVSLTIDGPFGAALPVSDDNLVLRAARALAGAVTAAGGTAPGVALHLDKRLPVASGIGGGSADAAATLRALARLWALPPAVTARLPAIAATLGADVPVCLDGRAARMRGIGDVLEPVALPPLGMVLVNPGHAVATAAVFAGRTGAAFSPPLPPVPPLGSVAALADWLRPLTNDLQPAAVALCPAIGLVLAALATLPGCRLARMSGSGATCFALMDDATIARDAAVTLRRTGWWCWGGEARKARALPWTRRGRGPRTPGV